jgi:hypothetical protein
METYLPIELREYAQYGPVFRIPDTFQAFLYSIKMVLDRKPIYQLPLNPTKRQTEIPILLQFLRYWQKDSIIHFMDVLQQEGLLGTPYQRVYFADKAIIM